MDVGEFSGCRLYTGLRLDNRLRLWTPTSAPRTISAVAELLVQFSCAERETNSSTDTRVERTKTITCFATLLACRIMTVTQLTGIIVT